MGLDMYLHKRKMPVENSDEYTEVAYWRKHYDLQDFVHEKIHQVENCIEFELTKEDIEYMLNFAVMELEIDGFEYDEEGVKNGEVDVAWQYPNSSWTQYQNMMTVQQLTKILKETNFEEEVISYWAWW